MSTAAALPPGTCLAGFCIESQIGRGGMGVVYRATQLSLERQVALKLISPELAGEERFREGFLREARLASLEHAQIFETRMNAGNGRAKNPDLQGHSHRWREMGNGMNPGDEGVSNPGPARRCRPRCYPRDLASPADMGDVSAVLAPGASPSGRSSWSVTRGTKPGWSGAPHRGAPTCR
jgi:hypothetical protein